MGRATNGQSQVPQLGTYKGVPQVKPQPLPNSKGRPPTDNPMPARPQLPKGYRYGGPVEAMPVNGRTGYAGEEFFGPRALAERLGLDYKKAWALMKDGDIKSFRVGKKWLTTFGNVNDYLEQNSSQKSALEALLQNLNVQDLADYQFRQELDRYAAQRIKEVSKGYQLKRSYAIAYVHNEISVLLQGKWKEGELENKVGGAEVNPK